MTFQSGFIKTALLTLLAVMTALPVRSQEIRGTEFTIDSMRTARMDSIYRSLNDTATWEREMEFVRNLSFDELNDSDLVMSDDEVQEQEQKHKRVTWKDIEQERINRYKRNNTGWEPEPRVAVWLSLLVPGGGQIYNRKLWKLPIVYGGYVGCIYALTWNQSTYMDYQRAYVDIMDNDDNTRSYEDFLPPHYEIDTSMKDWLKDVFKQRKNKYRRYRDLSIFAFAGMYVVAAIDAYVDAELSHFDISPDLSMRVEPNFMMDHRGTPTAGFSLAINF
ncbi:MAG: hypothetical protein IKN61_06840 [Bacteroidaceae bacterium]|jgi:hypothetical protein|nr:hypothetical protein [Bacteroidaceae bacterium]